MLSFDPHSPGQAGYLPMSQVWTLSLREVRCLAWTTQPVRVLSPKTQVPRAPSGWINPKLESILFDRWGKWRSRGKWGAFWSPRDSGCRGRLGRGRQM